MENTNTNTKSNACGITGLCLGALIPIAGLVLGIISLSRKEPNGLLGKLAIIVSLIAWVGYMALFSGNM